MAGGGPYLFGEHSMRCRAAIAVLVLVALTPTAGMATQQGTGVLKKWAASDKCAEQALKAFPDYTAEALAKRDTRYKQCLASQNLPPRD
jgi:hypothetical protein